MKNLFTVLLNFSDNTIGISQYEEKTPLEALMKFVKFSGALDGYDRDLLEGSLSNLHHDTHSKGIWTFTCTGPNNPIVGGTIVQTDPEAYHRPHHH